MAVVCRLLLWQRLTVLALVWGVASAARMASPQWQLGHGPVDPGRPRLVLLTCTGAEGCTSLAQSTGDQGRTWLLGQPGSPGAGLGSIGVWLPGMLLVMACSVAMLTLPAAVLFMCFRPREARAPEMSGPGKARAPAVALPPNTGPATKPVRLGPTDPNAAGSTATTTTPSPSTTPVAGPTAGSKRNTGLAGLRITVLAGAPAASANSSPGDVRKQDDQAPGGGGAGRQGGIPHGFSSKPAPLSVPPADGGHTGTASGTTSTGMPLSTTVAGSSVVGFSSCTHTPYCTQPTAGHELSAARTDPAGYTYPNTEGSLTGTDARTACSASASVVDMPAAVQGYVLRSLAIRWDDITLKGVIGEGGFGKVYRGRWQGNKVAVKLLKLESSGPAVKSMLQQEALIMSELRHPSIARVYGLVDEGQHQAIVMQYYRRGTLAKARTSIWYTSLCIADRLRLAQQVAAGMAFLHDRSFVHGDLKSSNLLFEDDGATRRRLVIADLGLATSLGAGDVPAMTVSISPPEVLANPRAPRSPAADVYAFSMVLLEMMLGRPPFAGLQTSEVTYAVCQGMRPTIPPAIPPDVVSLIEACWAQNPASRPTFAAIVPLLEASIKEHQQATTWGETTTLVTEIM